MSMLNLFSAVVLLLQPVGQEPALTSEEVEALPRATAAQENEGDLTAGSVEVLPPDKLDWHLPSKTGSPPRSFSQIRFWARLRSARTD